MRAGHDCAALQQEGGGQMPGQQLLLGGGRRESAGEGSADIVLSFFHRLGWIGELSPP